MGTDQIWAHFGRSVSLDEYTNEEGWAEFETGGDYNSVLGVGKEIVGSYSLPDGDTFSFRLMPNVSL
jgi:hypothetical protein